MEVMIRQAKMEEAKELAAIEAACFPAAEAASEQEISERMHAFLENFLVAELDGKIVGFIDGGTTDQPYLPDELYHDITLHKPEGDYQTVFGLDVLPEYRRGGIAGRLLDGLVQLSREQGKKGVVLTCKEHLIHYYENHGFVKYGLADSCHGGATWYDMRNLF
ncbi:MAG: GNAT family N-acetyltransferase [Lachnospiraceae bacterium]|nr:GNAT family N-acetyltransferase [Lachnospiraceae bacterium]